MKKKIIVSILVVISVLFLVTAHVIFQHKKNPVYEPQKNLVAPIEIPDKGIVTYSEAINKQKPVFVMFYADWCTYCRRFMPVFGKFAKLYKDKYNFAVVNIDKAENSQLVLDFHIISLPSLYIIDPKINHKFILNMAATVDENIIREELDNYLVVRNNFVK